MVTALLFGTIFVALVSQYKSNCYNNGVGKLDEKKLGTYYVVQRKFPNEVPLSYYFMNGVTATAKMNFFAYDAETAGFIKDKNKPDTPYRRERVNPKTKERIIITAYKATINDGLILHKRLLGTMIGEYALGDFPSGMVDHISALLEENNISEEDRRIAWLNIMYNDMTLEQANKKIFDLINIGIEQYKKSCGLVDFKKFDEEDVFCEIPFSF